MSELVGSFVSEQDRWALFLWGVVAIAVLLGSAEAFRRSKSFLVGLGTAVVTATTATATFGLYPFERDSPTKPLEPQIEVGVPQRKPKLDLDAKLDRVLRVGSCSYTSEFVRENPATEQARAATIWKEKNCKPKLAIEPPQLPAVIQDPKIVRLQTELARVNCYVGPIDGLWNHNLQKAINSFNALARYRVTFYEVDEMLAVVEGVPMKVCP